MALGFLEPDSMIDLRIWRGLDLLRIELNREQWCREVLSLEQKIIQLEKGILFRLEELCRLPGIHRI